MFQKTTLLALLIVLFNSAALFAVEDLSDKFYIPPKGALLGEDSYSEVFRLYNKKTKKPSKWVFKRWKVLNNESKTRNCFSSPENELRLHKKTARASLVAFSRFDNNNNAILDYGLKKLYVKGKQESIGFKGCDQRLNLSSAFYHPHLD